METDNVKSLVKSGNIPLPNVLRFGELVHALQNRAPGDPGFGAFYGPSGFGKSSAAMAAYIRTRCLLIELGDETTRKSIMQDILGELGVPYRPSAPVPELVRLIVTELQGQDKPLLIIDEADYLINKRLIELMRTILNRVPQLSIVLIGEERLLHNLQGWERVAGRILLALPALPCDLEAARELIPARAEGIEVADDLLEEIVTLSDGSARRVAGNLSLVARVAQTHGVPSLDLAGFRKLSSVPLYASTLPKPRPYGRVRS